MTMDAEIEVPDTPELDADGDSGEVQDGEVEDQIEVEVEV